MNLVILTYLVVGNSFSQEVSQAESLPRRCDVSCIGCHTDGIVCFPLALVGGCLLTLVGAVFLLSMAARDGGCLPLTHWVDISELLHLFSVAALLSECLHLFRMILALSTLTVMSAVVLVDVPRMVSAAFVQVASAAFCFRWWRKFLVQLIDDVGFAVSCKSSQ